MQKNNDSGMDTQKQKRLISEATEQERPGTHSYDVAGFLNGLHTIVCP